MSCGEATAIVGISLLLVLAIAIVDWLRGKAAKRLREHTTQPGGSDNDR